jgi:MFS family permease
VTAPRISRVYGLYALALLTLINVVNYMERNVIFALFQPIKDELALSDAHLGILGSAYILIFSIAALPAGILSDLRSRTGMTAFGVALWSVFTSLGGLVRNFGQLLACRAAVGLGGAAANAASTALVADYFTGGMRAVAMSIFTAGLALGGVLGILQRASSRPSTAGGSPSWRSVCPDSPWPCWPRGSAILPAGLRCPPYSSSCAPSAWDSPRSCEASSPS